MQRSSEFRWCSKYFFFKLFFISILLQYSLSTQVYEGDKRQGLIPLSRLGRARILTALDDRLGGSLLTYPRLGRRLWELTKTLIPYPRAGRLVVDPESLDYDIILNLDYASPEFEESSADTSGNNLLDIQKRGNMKLIPRIGRKKRSISENKDKIDHSALEDERENPKFTDQKHSWSNFDDSETNYLLSESKKSTLSKSAFSPRIGKKKSDYLEEYFENKRAAMFTPRIGRAALIPRIGRTDPRFRLRSRASFIPRIGRRAALIPRVGRSENS